MITTIASIDIHPVLDAYNCLEKNIQWTEYKHQGRQTGLQYKIDENPWSSAVGKRQGNEVEYTNLNPFFKNTIFEELIKKYKLLRTRLMWVAPYACYSMHKDQTPRIHVPMITNSECYFVFKKGAIQHLPVGSVYCVDTTQFHTFMNCSDKPRLHLVGVIDQ
jgi:hypothetical protein